MKAIFLCENSNNCHNVYNDVLRKKISAISQFDESVYKKEDIISSPDKFSDVQVVFSTWGMPTFTEDEIKACFPNLECVFYGAGTVQKFARPFLIAESRYLVRGQQMQFPWQSIPWHR